MITVGWILIGGLALIVVALFAILLFIGAANVMADLEREARGSEDS